MEQISAKGLIPWLIQYVKNSKSELGKVTWPAKKDTVKYSLLVIAISIIIAAFFSGLDWMLNIGLQELIALVA